MIAAVGRNARRALRQRDVPGRVPARPGGWALRGRPAAGQDRDPVRLLDRRRQLRGGHRGGAPHRAATSVRPDAPGRPRLGDVESGAVAAAFGDTASVVSGGLACVAGVLVVARVLPGFRRQRAGAPPARAPDQAADGAR
jgi:hypothetical protein